MATAPNYIVFTDASYRCASYNHSRGYCGYGVVILNTKTQEYTQFGAELGGRTVMYGEIWAIYRGVVAIRNLADGKPLTALVVSDNKFAVDALAKWIPRGIWNTSDWDCWRTKNGVAMKNQRIFRRIYDVIYDNPNLTIKFTHINSHLSIYEYEGVQRKLSRYRVKVTPDAAELFIEMNNLVDKIAGNITKKMKMEEFRGNEFMRLIPYDTDALV